MTHSDKDAGGECKEIYRAGWFLTQQFCREKKSPTHKAETSVKKENRR